jgi:small subunit ribosomal protein S1
VLLKHYFLWCLYDLGGVDGLIHITDLSWVVLTTQVLELDQKLNVVILDFDDEKQEFN